MRITFSELTITFKAEDEDEEAQIKSLKAEAEMNGFDIDSDAGKTGFTVLIHEDFT